MFYLVIAVIGVFFSSAVEVVLIPGHQIWAPGTQDIVSDFEQLSVAYLKVCEYWIFKISCVLLLPARQGEAAYTASPLPPFYTFLFTF